MSSDKDFVLESMRMQGRIQAESLQVKSADMTGTELNAQDEYIPDFTAAVKNMNMMDRKAGFVCRSSQGRVVKLLQPYDSTTYPGEPEELPAQWGFVWSTDPAKALPFIALATSPYEKGDCCTENGKVYRSKIKSNVHSPSGYARGWQVVTP